MTLLYPRPSAVGTLNEGADADLVVLDLQSDGTSGGRKVVVDQVWKFGAKVFDNA